MLALHDEQRNCTSDVSQFLSMRMHRRSLRPHCNADRCSGLCLSKSQVIPYLRDHPASPSASTTTAYCAVVLLNKQ
jgi:hypothetical protein